MPVTTAADDITTTTTGEPRPKNAIAVTTTTTDILPHRLLETYPSLIKAMNEQARALRRRDAAANTTNTNTGNTNTSNTTGNTNGNNNYSAAPATNTATTNYSGSRGNSRGSTPVSSSTEDGWDLFAHLGPMEMPSPPTATKLTTTTTATVATATLMKKMKESESSPDLHLTSSPLLPPPRQAMSETELAGMMMQRSSEYSPPKQRDTGTKEEEEGREEEEQQQGAEKEKELPSQEEEAWSSPSRGKKSFFVAGSPELGEEESHLAEAAEEEADHVSASSTSSSATVTQRRLTFAAGGTPRLKGFHLQQLGIDVQDGGDEEREEAEETSGDANLFVEEEVVLDAAVVGDHSKHPTKKKDVAASVSAGSSPSSSPTKDRRCSNASTALVSEQSSTSSLRGSRSNPASFSVATDPSLASTSLSSLPALSTLSSVGHSDGEPQTDEVQPEEEPSEILEAPFPIVDAVEEKEKEAKAGDEQNVAVDLQSKASSSSVKGAANQEGDGEKGNGKEGDSRGKSLLQDGGLSFEKNEVLPPPAGRRRSLITELLQSDAAAAASEAALLLEETRECEEVAGGGEQDDEEEEEGKERDSVEDNKDTEAEQSGLASGVELPTESLFEQGDAVAADNDDVEDSIDARPSLPVPSSSSSSQQPSEAASSPAANVKEDEPEADMSISRLWELTKDFFERIFS